MIHHPERSKEVTKAVRVLRKQGVLVSFPMQTANGEIIFAVGKHFTVTADQMLELLDRGELHAEGVRRLARAQASAALMRSFLARYGKNSWQHIGASSKHFLDDRLPPSK